MFDRTQRTVATGLVAVMAPGLLCSVHAQVPSPSPSLPTPAISAPATTPSPSPAQDASPAPAVAPAPVAAPSPSPTPSLLKKTGVKIQFLPPPIDGTISLGIYNHAGKLVRVLHHEAGADEFVAALDGFITHWDGLDDTGTPLPAGKYSASGYMVGPITIRAIASPPPIATSTNAAPTPAVQPALADTLASALPGLKFPNGKPFTAQHSVHVGLVGNPLDRDRAGSAELSVSIDDKGSFLELADGLPLKRISTAPNLRWAALGRVAPGEPLIVFQSDGTHLREFSISKVSNMMAFDCGDLDLAARAAPAPQQTGTNGE